MSANGVLLIGAVFFGVVIGSGMQKFLRARYDLRRTSNAIPVLERAVRSNGKDTFLLLLVAGIAVYAARHG